MTDSTIQVLEGLFASSETVEDANTGEVVGAKPLTATVAPPPQPFLGIAGVNDPKLLLLGAIGLICWFSLR